MLNLNKSTLSQRAASHLQASPSDPTAEAIKAAVDDGILRNESKRERRKYLGASSVGDECSRKIQYRFMNYPQDEGQSLAHERYASFSSVTRLKTTQQNGSGTLALTCAQKTSKANNLASLSLMIKSKVTSTA